MDKKRLLGALTSAQRGIERQRDTLRNVQKLAVESGIVGSYQAELAGAVTSMDITLNLITKSLEKLNG